MSDSGDDLIVEEKRYCISTERCGMLSVFVQGDLSQGTKKCVFLTVHDLGANHTAYHQFIEHPCMHEIKNRSVFVHIDVPGQEDRSPDLPDEFQFPRMQVIAEDMVTVLDHLRIPLIIGFGEGAGANVLARFGLAHPTRCLGLLLIHPTSNQSGVMEYFKDKFINWKLGNVGMNPTAEQYLVFHKFGSQLETVDNKEKLVQEYTEKLKTQINPRNLRRFIETFQQRTDISGNLKNLKMDCLLVTGTKASHVHAVHVMHSHMDKTKASLLKVDDIGDVLTEAPEKLAQSLLLFVKGIGLLTSVTMVGVDRPRTYSGGETDRLTQRRRTMSMEDYDQPRRKSITTGK